VKLLFNTSETQNINKSCYHFWQGWSLEVENDVNRLIPREMEVLKIKQNIYDCEFSLEKIRLCFRT
jgi:hypothetical protein